MMTIIRKNHLFWAVIFTCVFYVFAAQPVSAVSSKGKEFFLSFSPNVVTNNGNQSLYISSETAATGVVEVPGLGISESFSVEPFEIARIDLPEQIAQLPPNLISNLGIKVVSDEDITVYGVNQYRSTTDAFLGLPVAALGSKYRVLSYYGTTEVRPSQVAIVGVFDNTEITINQMIRLPGSPAGEPRNPFVINLNSGETYLLRATDFGDQVASGDLTGTLIESTAPIGVFGGAVCTTIPQTFGACDHIVEMMPPVATWGNTFLTVPLATRLNGDVFRVLASQDSTEIRINGNLVSTIDAGQFYEAVLTQRSIINTTAPALAVQYSPGQDFDGVVSDPFMMLISPAEQFLDNYSFVTLEAALGFVNNFVNVVAPTPDIASIVLDGEPIDVALFSPIGGSGFSGAQIPVLEGNHTISGAAPFGIYAYGFGNFDGYGYPGGMNFDLINPSGDQYPPNVKLMRMDNVIEAVAGDSEDINQNDFLDVGEDLNGNAIIDRRTEDLNGNNVLDPGEDTNSDGILDRDSGIFRIELAEGSENLELILDSFVPGALRAEFTIRIIDSSLPSSGTLIVTDGAGNTITEDLFFSDEVRLQNVRVVSTLSSDQIDLNQTTFNRIPDLIDVLGTETVIEWQFPSIAIGQLENLDYDVVLRNPEAGESRLVTHQLELYYDDVNGNPVYQALGRQVVSVLPSIFSVQVGSDRQDYTVDQIVSIETELSNLSQFDTVSSVELVILDSDGNMVASVGSFPSLELAANQMSTLDITEFNVGNTYLGTYTIRVIVRDEQGEIAAQSDSQFNIVAPTESQYAARVTTDKISYNLNETVTVQDRISNPAPNALLSGAYAITTVTAPNGSEFWRLERNVPEIAPQGLIDIFHAVPIETSAAGEYEVRLVLLDAEGVERASSEAQFTVNSTQDTGAGLVGLLDATPSPVLKTESVSVNVDVINDGNSAIENVPTTLSIVNVESQQVLQEWDLGSISASVGETQSFSREWLAIVDAGNQYAAVLSAAIGGEDLILATQSISVTEKLVVGLAAEGKGRVLVLLDDKRRLSKYCRGLGQLELSFLPDSVLLPQDQVEVQLYDKLGGLLDFEVLTISDFAGEVNQNFIATTDIALTDATADQVTVHLQSGQPDQALNGQAHRLVVTHTRADQISIYDSGLFGTRCNDVVEGQDLSQGFSILNRLCVDEADPYDRKGRPTKLTERKFLQTLLDSSGWSYTIVDNSHDYIRELRTGDYNVSALFNEKVKLSKAAQNKIVHAVNNGMGLLYAGFHDKRNGRIEPVLGIKAKGKLPHITGVEVFSPVLQDVPATLSFAHKIKAIKVKLLGADALAVYDRHGPTDKPAITDYQYGEGRSIFMGFDVLREAASAEADSRFAELILRALDHVHPDSLGAFTGRVIPVTLSLENLGTTVSGQVILTLPEGSVLIDPGPARLIADGSLLWPFLATSNEPQSWSFWLQLPQTPGSVSLSGQIEVATDDGQLIDYGSLQLDFDVMVE